MILLNLLKTLQEPQWQHNFRKESRAFSGTGRFVDWSNIKSSFFSVRKNEYF